jgi:hypothetical protein
MKKRTTEDFPHAWLPVDDWELADVMAVQALEKGAATEEQQKRALAWIINKACWTYESTFSPVREHDSSFAEGRRFAGLQIVKMLKINAAALSRKKP